METLKSVGPFYLVLLPGDSTPLSNTPVSKPSYGLFGVYMYNGTSPIRSPMGLGKSDLNGDVTVLQGDKLHCGIQFGTDQG